MQPELKTFGNSESRVVIIDGFRGRVDDLRILASTMAPFPSSDNTYYPGRRRMITTADAVAYAYVEQTLEACAPFIGGAFDIDAFAWDEASFSMVTTPPGQLLPTQRAPHFDRIDPYYLAILHYLSPTPDTGTAFYRHRATGIEQIAPANFATFVETARRENETAPQTGYIAGSNSFYEQIGYVEAVPDRLIIYRGCQLHSGIVPPGMTFSEDPLLGRLTANIFVQGR